MTDTSGNTNEAPTPSRIFSGSGLDAYRSAPPSESESSIASHRDLLPQHPSAGMPNPGVNASGSSSSSSVSGTTAAGPPSASGRTGSMGPPPLPPHHMGGQQSILPVPQIRSRVTVVCAECKRLKLKCDRRFPCGSCSKRDTVARCIYTAAAAEKVDVQSIHNRLLNVEGTLEKLPAIVANTVAAGITSSHAGSVASTPATTASALPAPYAAVPTTVGMMAAGPPRPGVSRERSYSNMGIGMHQHHRYQHYPGHHSHHQHPGDPVGPGGAVAGPGPSTSRSRILALDPRGASVVVHLDGVTGLWVGELEAEFGAGARTSASTGSARRSGAGNVRLRPLDRACTFSSASSSVPRPGIYGLPPADSPTSLLARFVGLPVGLPSSGHASSDPFGLGPGGGSGVDASATLSPGPDEDPYASLTDMLVARLPPEPARSQMMERLRDVLVLSGAPCIPFNAFRERVESLFTPGVATSKGKGRSTGDETAKERPSLSLVAAAFAGLAVGALISLDERTPSPECTPSEATLSGGGVASPVRDGDLSEAAGGVGFHRTTPHTLYRLARTTLQLHAERHGHAALDPEFMFAYTLCARYIMFAHRSSKPRSPGVPYGGARGGGYMGGMGRLGSGPDPSLPPELPPLLGEIVWHARVMGLGVDPDEFDDASDLASEHEPEAIFAEGVDNASMGGGSERGSERSRGRERRVKSEEREETMGTPGSARSGRMSPFMKEVRRRLWYEIIGLDFMVAHSLGHRPSIEEDEYSTRLPTDVNDEHFKDSSPVLPPPNEDSPTSNISYFIHKYRILQAVKGVMTRMHREAQAASLDGIEDPNFVTARALANELSDILETLPERFKLKEPDDMILSSPPPMDSLLPTSGAGGSWQSSGSPSAAASPQPASDSPSLVIQRCELVILVNHAITQLFLPRPRVTGTNGGDGPPDRNARPGPQLSGLFAIEPAFATVNAAQLLHTMRRQSRPAQSPFYVYHFSRTVFDAAVVLAYIAIQQPLYTASSVLESVRTALGILRYCSSSALPGRISSGIVESGPSEAVQIVEMLLARAEAAGRRTTPIVSGTKRKHEEVDDGSADLLRQTFRFPFVGPGVFNTAVSQTPGSSAWPIDITSSERTAHSSGTSEHSSSKPKLRSPTENKDPSRWGTQSSDPKAPTSSRSHHPGAYSIRRRPGNTRHSGSAGSHIHPASTPALPAPTIAIPSQPFATSHPTQLGHSMSPTSGYPGPSAPPQHFGPPPEGSSTGFQRGPPFHPSPSTPSFHQQPFGSMPPLPMHNPQPTNSFEFFAPPPTGYATPSQEEYVLADHHMYSGGGAQGHPAPGASEIRFRGSIDLTGSEVQHVPQAGPFHSHSHPAEPHLQPRPHSQAQPPWPENTPTSHARHWGDYPYWNNESS